MANNENSVDGEKGSDQCKHNFYPCFSL